MCPAQPQPPEPATDFAPAPGHVRLHVEPPEQFSEQLPVHVMLHVAPPEQSTLALAPTVMSHVDEPVHLRLHDSPQEPAQSLLFAQSSEQLLPHVAAEISQAAPDGQLQVEPLQVGGVPVPPPPHATRTETRIEAR